MVRTFDQQDLINDKIQLLLKFNYVSAYLSIIIGFACIFFMKITEVIPYAFFIYAILNLINAESFKKHGNIYIMVISTSILSLLGTLTVSLYSGGIESPFMFILAIIVLAGYISTKRFGQVYFSIVLIVVTLVYILSISDLEIIKDVVPQSSKALFSYITMLFSVYLLGSIFGRNLINTQYKLYKTKIDVENKIAEKDNLLKEIHHRVKNNLQTVSSLLNLQSRNIDDKQVKSLFKNSQNRIISMAMVHEMLYVRENLSKIEYANYVQDLAEYLIRSIKGSTKDITLKLDIVDINLNIDTAIPVGLLINEIITNALKYGIQETEKGEIYVSIQNKENAYELRIGDNGSGFAECITHQNSKSLGLKLIHNLARQLLGSVSRETSSKGTHYVINFKEVNDDVPSVA